jgi:oligosaccharide translocation protein RFT1
VNRKEAITLVKDFRRIYCILIKLMVYIGLMFATFGSNYTSVLLKLMTGDKWGTNDDAASVLSAFCIYTAFMALNGITEAFVYGVAESGLEVGSLTAVHALIGLVFYAIAPFLVANGHLFGISGTVGLVVANGICMVLRSIFSLRFAFAYFNDHLTDSHGSNKEIMTNKIRQLIIFSAEVLPRQPMQALFLSCYIIMSRSRRIFMETGNPCLRSIDTANHLGVGMICLAIIGVFAFIFEKDFERSLYIMILDRTKQMKQKEQ